jgi:hypothetical protein
LGGGVGSGGGGYDHLVDTEAPFLKRVQACNPKGKEEGEVGREEGEVGWEEGEVGWEEGEVGGEEGEVGGEEGEVGREEGEVGGEEEENNIGISTLTKDKLRFIDCAS